jgi:hypothetical protein
MSVQGFLTVDNVVIIFGLIGTIASVLALVQATRALYKSEKRKALIDSALFLLFCAASVGAFYYWSMDRPAVQDTRLQARSTGLLKAANSELLTAMRSLQISLPTEEAGVTSPVSPSLPHSFNTLIADGEVFSSLSTGLQEELPRFVRSIETFTEAYKQGYAATKKAQPGTLLLMWLSCYIQDVFVNLELLFQGNQLSKEQVAARQTATLSYEAMLMMLRTKGDWAFPAQSNYAEVSDLKEGRDVLCFGQILDDAVAAVNSSAALDNSAKKEVALSEAVVRKLGLALDFRQLAEGATKGSDRYGKALTLISDGTYALHGERLSASLDFGYLALTTLDDFEKVITDDEFRHQNWQHVVKEGEDINGLISPVLLPEEMKKAWVPIFGRVMAVQPDVPPMISAWKQQLVQYCTGTGD